MIHGRSAGVALAAATSTAVGYTYASHAPVIPLIAAEFGLDDFESGLMATAMFLASGLAMLVRGDVGDRFPTKAVLTTALVLAIAGNVGQAVAPDYLALLAARAVGGVGSALCILGGLRYVAARYGGERPHFGQGLFGAGFPLGSAVALWVMPPLAVALGWRGAFGATTLAMCAVLLLWLLAPPVASHARRTSILIAGRCANCWWTAVQHAAGFGLALAAGTWITVYLLREFSLPLEASGLLGSVLLVLAVIARPIGGQLVSGHHLSTLGVMRGAQVAILLGIALLALPDRPLLLAVLGAVAVGFGGGLPYAAVFNTAAASLPRSPGAAQSLTALGGLASALAGAPAMGYAVQTWGFSAAWLILGAISVAALGVSFVMRGEEQLG
ncbi:MAG: MFS transporter [Candidatus Limnocylindria bacterium]